MTHVRSPSMRRWLQAALYLVVALLLSPFDPSNVCADDVSDIMRYDPVTDRIEPVTRDEMKPGFVYRHTSARLGRPVWSYLQADGQFWNAFGEGTTQLARQFDVRWSKQEAITELLQTDPKLADQIRRAAKPIRLRLQSDNTWRSIGSQEVVSIFDAETGRRWEDHHDRYVPVISSHGSQWTVRSGDYVPVGFTGSVK